MTDPQTATGFTGRRLPQPTFFDPAFERLPAAAAYDPDRPGPVLLLFDPRAHRAWVADAAIALATGWYAAGRRTVLADLSLEDPILHERVGVPNLDGVVDLFLYGASLARSARPVPGRGFLLITAGTYSPEPEAIFRHQRWGKIVDGFREAQASLLLFVPIDAPGLAALAQYAEDVVLLGDREDGDLLESLVDPRFHVRPWLTPPARPGADGRGAPPAPSPARIGTVTVSAADRALGEPVGRPAAPPPAPAAPAERFPQPEPGGFQPWLGPPREPARTGDEPLPSANDIAHAPAASLPAPGPEWEDTVEPAGKRRKKKSIPKERKVSPLLLVLLVLALMAAAIAAAVTYLPGLLNRGSNGPPAPATRPASPARRPVAAATAAPAAEAGTRLPYAVHVKAFQGVRGFDTARQLAARVREAFPGTPAYVFVEEEAGLAYYKVYAGMLDDTVQAAALRTELVERRLADPEDVGGPAALIQARPYAFDLGEYPTRQAAEARAGELVRGAIDSYAVPVPQSDGSERYRLYAGAFADSARAVPMQKTLEAARLPAKLVRRVGRAPATQK
ncbi:MAG TPA: SPOR domain-containing protein [Longimicrobium sp.]|nr:SPOR domain-containing protein [Longimicrobium sp.]